MGEHADLMANTRMTRAQYLSAVRRQQPIEELRRKAIKAERLRGRLWTQEQIDLFAAEAVELLIGLN